MSNPICLKFNTGQFYHQQGTISRSWLNGPYAPGSEVTYRVERVKLWGGLSIGANMDFAAALYVTGLGTYYQMDPAGWTANDWLPLAVTAFDRYGDSNGGVYEQTIDWTDQNILVYPNQQMILQANCFNHGIGRINPVFGYPGDGDNAHAQAWVWMRAI